MKHLAVIAVMFSLLAIRAEADDVSGQALLAFQQYHLGSSSTSGVRQTYDVRWQGAPTLTSLVRLYVRGEDFRGSNDSPSIRGKSRTRQLQPIGEFLINAETLRAHVRTEYLDTTSSNSGFESSSTLSRSSADLEWAPADLPIFSFRGQRDQTKSPGFGVGLTEEAIAGGLRYEWRGLQTRAEERFNRTADPFSGYERQANTHMLELAYNDDLAGGRVSISAITDARLGTVMERSTSPRAVSVPVPVPVSRALFAVDETPTDGQDHPLSSYPALIDGNVNKSAGVALGPEATSFQNLVLDFSSNQTVDEIRIVVRDASGNPIRTGGGPVTWDLYTSEDGQLWTPHEAQSLWNAALSYYAVTFTATGVRWLKVVNFGVNVEATAVTELQPFEHRLLVDRGRSGKQDQYNAALAVRGQPTKRLRLSYAGVYGATRQSYAGAPATSLDNLEHLGEIAYDVLKTLTLREQFSTRASSTVVGGDDTAHGLTSLLEWTPTRQLRMSVEVGRDAQDVAGSSYVIDSRVVRASAAVIRSVLLTFQAGTQTQTFVVGGSKAERRFANLTGSVQLLRSVRLDINAALQQTDQPTTNTPQILGPQKDNRVSGELTWRPGPPLILRAKLGWLSGAALTGLTQQYHAEWYPFQDGTVSLGGTYDHDIDPVFGRRASRVVLTPRWTMNRFASFDINYTSVSSGTSTATDQQKTLFATLTLTR